MALNNIKRNSGFTIVELLIVIVVIAILATISIVSYTGIQNRAKASAAQANAVSVQKAAEAYYAENGSYPTTLVQFNTSLVKYPTNVTVSITDPAGGTNGERAVEYHYTPTTGSATGARIRYWDYQTGAISTNIIYLGNATSGSTYNSAAL
jgi:prepilin-type N-terminal cleavage/methylation domain-containing protein